MPKILSKLFDRERYRKSWLKLFQSSENIKNSRQSKVARKSIVEKDENSSWKSSSADDSSSIQSTSDYDGLIRDNHQSKRRSSKKSKRDRHRLRRKNKSFSDSSHDEKEEDDEAEFLTKEELYELPAKVLRSKCHNAGLDTRNAIRKKDLVNLLFSFFENKIDMSTITDSRSYHQPLHQQNEDEEDEMRNLEILPFYGQGDEASDQVVHETIEKLTLDSLELPDSYGNNILMLACQYSAHDLVPLLIRKGCDVNARNNDGSCCLHYACYTETLSIEIVELLIRNGAQAEVIEKHYGCTPLHWAAASGDTYLCELLIDAGALLSTIDSNEYDPISYAKQAGNDECVKFLQSRQKTESVEKVKVNMPISDNQITDLDIEIDKQKRPFSFDDVSHLSESSDVDEGKVEKDEDRSSCNDRRVIIEVNSFDESSDESYLVDKPKQLKEERTVLLTSPIVKRHDVSEFEASVHDSGYVVRPRTVTRQLSFTPRKSSIAKSPLKKENSLSVTKETFEERLSSLQLKMEEQLMQQLSLLEDKISKSRRPQTPGLQRQHQDDSNAIVEMSSNIIQLQNEISTKDVEILSLKREIVALESKLASNICQRDESSLHSKVELDFDPLKELISSEEKEKLKEDIASKEEKLRLVEEKNKDLVADLNNLERQLISFEEKYSRIEEQLKVSEDSLSKERNAKDEVMSLLEQTRQGMEVDAQVTKSLEEAKKSDAEEISRLCNDLKTLEGRSNADSMRLMEEINKKEKLLLAEEARLSSLNETIHQMKEKHEDERENLRLQHQKVIGSLNNKLNSEQELVENLRNELKEERLVKMQKELERNEAFQEMTSCCQRASEAERKLDEMKSMIEEAKGLFLNNEKLHRALHIETERRKNLHNKIEDMKGKIRVYVRIRPISNKELEQGYREILNKEDQRMCSMPPDDEKVNSTSKSWEFDQIFSGHDGNSQEAIFKDTRLLITSAIDGFNVCIFAYGQTGSGKTYTLGLGFIQGLQSDGSIEADAGLAPRAAAEVFRVLKEKEASCNVDVMVNMFEIYNDSLRDLLANPNIEQDKLRIKLAEHSDSGMVEVEGAIHEKAECLEDLLKLFERGAKNRTTSSTNMNTDSSRSHLITSIITSVSNKRTGHTVNGKLTIVDLAGSERVGKSGATGNQLKEAQSINKSLSALGDVICALTNGKSGHIPYRNNPLTMLMSDSLGGSSKTLMFVCCSPADYNRSESCNSLDFAKRCKDVRNKVDQTRGDTAKIKALREELARMKRQEQEGKTKSKSAVVKGGRRPGF